jgi:hypothetical protein
LAFAWGEFAPWLSKPEVTRPRGHAAAPNPAARNDNALEGASIQAIIFVLDLFGSAV